MTRGADIIAIIICSNWNVWGKSYYKWGSFRFTHNS